ncbi:MAG: hypothetical protein V2J24_08810 [Pseudomonadales bacterium]|nr:hypothetical protein [Pseudomonadales bacterium]
MKQLQKTLLASLLTLLAGTALLAPTISEAGPAPRPAPAQKKPATTANSATRQRPASRAPRNRQTYSNQTRPEQRQENQQRSERRASTGTRVVAATPAAAPAAGAPTAGGGAARPRPINVARSPLASFSAAGQALAQSQPATPATRRTPGGRSVTFRVRTAVSEAAQRSGQGEN